MKYKGGFVMIYLLLATSFIVIATIAYGLLEVSNPEKNSRKKIKRAIVLNLSAFIPVIAAVVLIIVVDMLFPASISAATTGETANSSSGLGYIAAALSTGLATIGAGYAVGTVGASALGAVSEDPKILGKTLIFVGLAEGIAIYGLIVSIMILSKL